MAKYCTKCGSRNDDSVLCCTMCGTPFLNNSDKVNFVRKSDRTNNKRESGKSLFAFILSLTIIFSPIALVIALRDMTSDDKSKSHKLSITAIVISYGIAFLIALSAIFTEKLKSVSENDTNYEVTKQENIKPENTKTIETSQPIDENDVEDNQEDVASSKQPESSDVEKSGYISNCITVEYDDVARNPNKYKEKDIIVKGSVIQVSEGFFNNVTLRVSEAQNGYDDIWYVTYKRDSEDEKRILEGDLVTIYGTCNGVKDYVSILGSTITIPSIEASFVELGQVVDGRTIEFDAEKVASGLQVMEYKSDSEYGHYYYLVVKNTSAFPLDITANVKYYDDVHNLIGADSKSSYAVESGYDTVITLRSDESYAKTEYSLDLSVADWNIPAQSNLTYDVIQKKSKLIITMKNEGDVAVSSASCICLFLKDDQVVCDNVCYFSDNDYELKPGKDMTKELKSYEEYDSYLIFVSGNKKKK